MRFVGLAAILALAAGLAPVAPTSAMARQAQADPAGLPWRVLGTDHVGNVFKVLAPEPSPDNANWRQIAVLTEYAQPVAMGGVMARSALDITEVDCTNFNYRILMMNYYTGPTLKGQAHGTSITDADLVWGPSPQPAMARRVAEAACR